MILTAFVKFAKVDPNLNSKILPIFEKYKTSWDEEIQQRCIEYEQLILLSNTTDEAWELFATAFDDMPTYPEHMQSNNVLMKWITEIKSEKGFIANKGDEEIAAATSPTIRSVVSSALSRGGEQ